MSLLAGVLYDPAVAVSKATSALLAMTAVDTTNLRVTFKVPQNGSVLVRLQTAVTGATTYPRVLLGVLEGATVRGRMNAIGGIMAALATDVMPLEASYVVTGLTPGATVTWDAAYGVEVLLAATNVKYGGPNTNAGANAWGGFAFEVYDTIPLIASALYDPGTAAAKSGAALLAMTALDTTNLRLTFKAPASGEVYWRLRVPWLRGASVWGQILLGILESTTVRARVAPQRGMPQTSTTTTVTMADASGVITGLTPGSSFTWDAAYAVQTINGGTIIEYGGPNDTTTNNAWGGAVFEIWAV